MSASAPTWPSTPIHTSWDDLLEGIESLDAWKEKQQAWDVTNILGIYFQSPSDFLPGNVVVEGKDSQVESINITADFARTKKAANSSIRGTVSFEGNWPKETESVQIVASTQFPPTNILDLVVGPTIPLEVDSYDYVLTAPPGEYQAIGIIWKQKRIHFNLWWFKCSWCFYIQFYSSC